MRIIADYGSSFVSASLPLSSSFSEEVREETFISEVFWEDTESSVQELSSNVSFTFSSEISFFWFRSTWNLLKKGEEP